MDNKEILEKAIQKAIDGGWVPVGGAAWCDAEGCTFHDKPTLWSAGEPEEYPRTYEIIFNHDFAKALWGEELKRIVIGAELADGEEEWGVPWNIDEEVPNWQYHLSQMVIAPDPIKYLQENI